MLLLLLLTLRRLRMPIQLRLRRVQRNRNGSHSCRRRSRRWQRSLTRQPHQSLRRREQGTRTTTRWTRGVLTRCPTDGYELDSHIQWHLYPNTRILILLLRSRNQAGRRSCCTTTQPSSPSEGREKTTSQQRADATKVFRRGRLIRQSWCEAYLSGPLEKRLALQAAARSATRAVGPVQRRLGKHQGDSRRAHQGVVVDLVGHQ